jgi:hypothetical protein
MAGKKRRAADPPILRKFEVVSLAVYQRRIFIDATTEEEAITKAEAGEGIFMGQDFQYFVEEKSVALPLVPPKCEPMQ